MGYGAWRFRQCPFLKESDMKNAYIVKYKPGIRRDATVCASNIAEARREAVATLRHTFGGSVDYDESEILSVEPAPDGTPTGTHTSRAYCEYETDSPEWRRIHDGTTSAILEACRSRP